MTRNASWQRTDRIWVHGSGCGSACVAEQACVAITFWGILDQDSWLNDFNETGCGWGESPLPLLWDDSYGRKGTRCAVMDALTGR